MPLLEKGSREWEAVYHRIHRKIMNVVSNVAARRANLPEQVCVLVHDDVTGERFGSYVRIQHIGDKGMLNITRNPIMMVAPGIPLTKITDKLLADHHGMPLVCDRKVANELSGGSIPWIEEDHYRLEGRPGGVLEVYLPYQAIQVSIGVANVQLFTE